MLLYKIIELSITIIGIVVLIGTVSGAIYLVSKSTRDLAQDEYERENSYWYDG